MDGYERLANAIVLQAAKDYRSALQTVRKNPVNGTAKLEVQECERFFRSKWYSVLTSVDGEYLMKRLREEVEAE